MVESKSLLKVVSVYLIYFICSYLGSLFTSMLKLESNPIFHMIMDIAFLIFIIALYQKDLKSDWDTIKKEYSFKKIGKVILLGLIGTFLLNFLLMFIGELFFPNSTVDQNTMSIQNMATVSVLYTIFKTMIFGSIAEEILFRESLSKCISNDYLLIFVSSIIYTAMNFIFTTQSFGILQLLAYFLPAILYSFIYVKNNRNIILIMFVKFVYNLIPLTILLVGLFAK